MIDNYYDKNGWHEWRTYCDSCHALVDDTAPGKISLSRSDKISGICPVCKGKITIPDAPKWEPPIR